MIKIVVDNTIVDAYYKKLLNDFNFNGKNYSGLNSLITENITNPKEQNDLLILLPQIITSKPNQLEKLTAQLSSMNFSIQKNYNGYILNLKGVKEIGKLSYDEFKDRLNRVDLDPQSQKITAFIENHYANTSNVPIEVDKFRDNELKGELKRLKIDITEPKVFLKKNAAWTEIFKYKVHFQPLISDFFGKNLKIKVCPYCNNQFTQTVENVKVYNDKTNKFHIKSTLNNFELDHIFPKSNYPYFALSFYNLIPSCNNCNGLKSAIDTLDINLKLIHPYEDSFHDLVKFETTKETDENQIRKLLGDKSFIPNSIDVKLVEKSNTGGKLANHEKIFHLTEIYKQHTDIISEIYAKAYFYNQSRRDELVREFNNLGFSDDEITMFILGNYVNPEDFNLRPHSKLTYDIAEEIKLLPHLPKSPKQNRVKSLNNDPRETFNKKWYQRFLQKVANILRKFAFELDKL